jgi:hypothetical protein
MTFELADPNDHRASKGTKARRSLVDGVVTGERESSVNDLELALRKLERRERQTARLAELGELRFTPHNISK